MVGTVELDPLVDSGVVSEDWQREPEERPVPGKGLQASTPLRWLRHSSYEEGRRGRQVEQTPPWELRRSV